MYKLKKVILTNFRSYNGTHDFTFPTTVGLYYFTGINEVESIGSNGAGKSTFLDAIVWCLYGSTSRGLKASDVLTDWEGQGTSVTVTLEVGDRTFVVKRTHKPNNLTLDDTPVDQADLENAIRLNLTAFTHSVLFPQFGSPFFSLSSSEKLKLFSDFMNLNFWLDCSKEAADSAASTQTEILKIQKQIHQMDGELGALEVELPQLERDEVQYARNKQLKLDQLKTKMTACEDDYYNLDSSIANAVSDVINTRNHVQWTENQLKRQEKGCDSMLKHVIHASRVVIQLETDYKTITADLAKIQDTPPSTCPLCGGKMNLRHRADEISRLYYCLKSVEINLKDNNKLADQFNEKLAHDKLGIQSLNQTLEEQKDMLSEAVIKETKLKHDLKALEEKYESIKAQRTELKKQANPYTEMLTAKKSKLHQLKLDLVELYDRTDKLEAEFEAYSFWKGGFRRLRLYVIEQAFEALTLEVNNCLAQLGMPGWEITFDIERENKSGGITKGFMVLVKSPRNKQPVKWENWSGGETQRLQLAGDLGLANLIMHQAGLLNCNEWFDEPSTHLSPEGMMDLADMLHERAITEDKCIWIVDHAAISNFGDFQQIITVRKTSNGSFISTD